MKQANSAGVDAIIGRATRGVVALERRSGRDRRTGVDRRNCSVEVEFDRRGGDDRRTGFDRRAKGLEPLEARSMFSAVSFEDGILVVRGDSAAANELTVSLKSGTITGNANGQSQASVSAGKVRLIRIIGGEKADRVSVDASIKIPVVVQTGDGNDSIMTGAGNDLVHSGNGADWVETGPGQDVVRAGNGRDTVIAGAGHDLVWGGNGSDLVMGKAGNDRLNGGSGDNRVFGGNGKDRIDVGNGKSELRGGDGNDTLVGDADDSLNGDHGDDKLTKRVSTGNQPPEENPVEKPSEKPAETPTAPTAFTFSLINVKTGKAITGYDVLTSGQSFDLNKLPTRQISITANLPAGFQGGSVAFAVNGATVSVQNAAPFALGNSGGWTFAKGTYTLTAIAYTQPNAKGEAGKPVQIKFTVTDSASFGNNGGTNTGGTGGQSGNTGGSGNTGNAGSGAISGNENPNPSAAAPEARFTTLGTEIDAGHSIHVNGLSSKISSGSHLSAKFEWDFGDPGSRFNKLVGFTAGHLYTKPGTYTVKLTVTDNTGRSDVVTKTVTVNASSRRVYYVSPAGSDSNDGLSPASAIRSWDKVRTLLNDNTEFRFQAGQTFNVTSNMAVRFSNVMFSSYGSGDRPTLKWTGVKTKHNFFQLYTGTSDVTVRDLTFDSVFSNHQEKTGVPTIAGTAGRNFSLVNCQILNINYAVNNEAKPTGVLVQDNVSPSKVGLRAYLSYVQGTDHVIIGNTVANSTREHVVRSDGGQRVLIAYNDFTNIAQGRPGDQIDIMKQTITVHWGRDVYVYGNNTHGGRVEIGPLGEGDGLSPTSVNTRLASVVVDSNHFDFHKYQRLEIDHGSSGVMVRSNKIVAPTGAGVSIQAQGKYTNWPGYGERRVENVWVTSDNQINAERRVSVGRGAVNVNVAEPSGARTASASSTNVTSATDALTQPFSNPAQDLFEYRVRAA